MLFCKTEFGSSVPWKGKELTGKKKDDFIELILEH